VVTTATTKDYRGRKVLGGKKGTRKIGKVLHTVFHPTKPYVVGFIVKRPDFLLMVKRRDRFIAFDAVELVDGRLSPTMGPDSWDEKAIRRLDLDYDKCIIWENMPVRTDDGQEMGTATNITFDARTGKVICVNAGDGALAKSLLGTYDIPLEMIHGYESGYLVFSDDAALVEASGGLAAKAGAGTAKAGAKMKEAGKKTGEAVNKGAYQLGGALGKTKDAMEASKEKYQREASSSKVDEDEEKTLSYNLGKAVGKGRKALEKQTKGGSGSSGSGSGKKSSSKESATPGMFAAFKSEYDKARKGDR